MNKPIRIHPYPQDPTLEELAKQLLEVGAVLSQIVGHMVRAGAAGQASPEAAPIPDLAGSLVAEALADVKPKHSRRDLKVAAAIVGEATDAICENIFTVDLDALAASELDDDADG
jgi:hypothetical protein